MSVLKNPFAWVCAGVILVGFVLFWFATPEAPDDGPVECAGEVMRMDDLCLVYENGTAGRLSYETMKKRQENSGRDWDPVVAGFAGATVLLGVGGMVYFSRR